MTPQEYGKIAEWFAEGKLEGNMEYGWREAKAIPPYEKVTDVCFSTFRRRLDAQPMPDEVWLPDNVCLWRDTGMAKLTGQGIRYVRADGVIDGERLEFRTKLAACTLPDCKWTTLSNCEIRFKP